MNWKHDETWTTNGKNFTLEIAHKIAVCDPGPNRWFITVWLREQHPLFAKAVKIIDHTELIDFLKTMPMHQGISLITYTQSRVLKLGCDYKHLGDEEFTRMFTSEEAEQVFEDAENLYRWLEEYK